MAQRRRRRSGTNGMLADIAYIGNRAPWQLTLLIGIVSFCSFYWLMPGFLESRGGSGAGAILIRKWVRVFEWIGIAILLLSVFFAGRNYLGRGRISQQGERDASMLSKLIARWLR